MLDSLALGQTLELVTVMGATDIAGDCSTGVTLAVDCCTGISGATLSSWFTVTDLSSSEDWFWTETKGDCVSCMTVGVCSWMMMGVGSSVVGDGLSITMGDWPSIMGDESWTITGDGWRTIGGCTYGCSYGCSYGCALATGVIIDVAIGVPIAVAIEVITGVAADVAAGSTGE